MFDPYRPCILRVLRRTSAAFLLAVFALAAVAAQSTPATAQGVVDAVRDWSGGRRLPSLDPFEKWRDVLDRIVPESGVVSDPASMDGAVPGFEDLRRLVRSLAGAPPSAQVVAVNAFFNALPYRSDPENYGVPDYWATPAEFLLRGAGDCEDYAIAKFMTLLTLGFAPDHVALIAGYDRSRGRAHVVAAVLVGEDVAILDNNRTAPAAPAAMREFLPLYAVDLAESWVFLRAAAERPGMNGAS